MSLPLNSKLPVRLNALNFKYPFIPLAPSAPSDVRVTQNGLNSILVSWTAGDMSVTGYFISYSSEEGRKTNSLSAEENDTNITISGLTIGEDYTVNISASSSMLPSAVVTIGNIILGMTKYGTFYLYLAPHDSPQNLPIFYYLHLHPHLSWLEVELISPALSLFLVE